jgi:hypothetical protein
MTTMPDKSVTNNAEVDLEMNNILERLLDQNENITARAVARLHPVIGHASSITRSSVRSALLAQYQEKQRYIRAHVGSIKKRSRENIAADLASKDQKITELEKQVEVLRASHLAMIRVVGELGGMSKWLKFFEHYKNIRDDLEKLGAMPKANKVVHLPSEE